MQHGLNDNDPGRPKAVTNADEQDVAVNHSTAEEGGYAEPSHADPQPVTESKKDSPAEEPMKGIKKGRDKGQSSQTGQNNELY